MNGFSKTKILGIPIHLTTLAAAVTWAEDRVRTGQGGYICHVGAHGLVDAQSDSDLFQALGNADLAATDGMPLVWLGRWRGMAAGRVYGPDFMEALLTATGAWTDRPCRHFLFGSSPEVLEALRQRITARFPGAIIAGHLSPPFRAASAKEEDEHLDAIRQSQADVVWVGLGCPRQEKWMAHVADRLPGLLLVGVGAAFDFLAETKRRAPPWIGRSGLEWAYRCLTEPRRLARRYGRIVPAFLWLLARDALHKTDR